ncbi:hypothetical protein [Haloterrigena alkaliphila]|uniref:Uncharacterized protein n=1 Tax=Haloterrigena alkaliphila TaxID=2816475 RepID=A0A8A2VJZ3_9EURY|nr:hypothetical protein [Haloterrigena alkaliphila]QSX00938.1 hypothetical protein J0X25_08250 [Haloterrigena alkaliphila]
MVLSVLLLGAGVLFTGAVAAEESTLEGMEGNGTEADPYVITDVEELQAMNEDRYGHYVLSGDISAEETAAWGRGTGFKPVGDQSSPFHGSLDGKNHTIEGLTIDRATAGDVGLFGVIEGSVHHLQFEAADIHGGNDAGVIAGENFGEISSVYAVGTVEGSRTGGLVGVMIGGRIEDSGADVTVTGDGYAGGVVGSLRNGEVVSVYATGDVEGSDAGGLAGQVSRQGGELRLAYATGDVRGDRIAGSLNGRNYGPTSLVFATGEVTGGETSGLVGRNDADYIQNHGTVTYGYWDVDTTGQTATDSYDDIGVPLTNEEITGAESKDNLDGFNFEHFWVATDDYPVFDWQVEDVSVTVTEPSVQEGHQTDVTVTLTLDDGSTVTASETADYETDDLAAVDAGVVEAHEQGTTEITATVAGHSDTAKLEITEPPNIELEDASLEALAVVNGTESEATATYANDGGPGGHTAELTVDGETIATERVWLGADDETMVTFEWTPDGDAGTEYDVAVDETDLGTLTVVDAETVSLESLSAPDQISPGTPYEVTVDLATDRDEPVRTSVSYEFGTEHSVTESVVIEPSDSTVGFEHVHDATPGVSLPHTVALEGETFETISEVVEPPTFEITDVDVPEEVPIDETFELAVSVENTGDLDGTQSIAVEGADAELANEELTVGTNTTETVSATVTESVAGDYEYTVSSADDERTVSVAIEGDDDGSESSATENSDGSDGVPGFGPIAALVTLSLVAPLVRR